MADAVIAATRTNLLSADATLPIALAFTAGFVDTMGFIALFTFFTAHVTGNFVVIGAALVRPHSGLLAKLLALPVFICAVGGARLYERSIRRRNDDPAFHLLAAELGFLLLFMILGLWATPVVDGDAPSAILTALSGVIPMGIQNAASRTVFASLSPTTVMTGNVTQLVLDAVDLMAGVAPDLRPALLTRLRKFWPPVVGFGLGAAAGAAAYGAWGFTCLLVPSALVGLLAARAARART